MSWKLKIKDKTDEKMLLNFPNDPYSNITIHTKHQELHLTLAYLVIDSGYFSQIDPTTQCIHLKHLEEKPLLAVLRALYGDELQVSTVHHLEEILKIIEYLDVEQYKENISKRLISLHESKPEQSPLYSIQMLEFCLKNSIIKDFICQIHLQNKLQELQSSKNYLQLGKLSKDHLNQLLLSYLALEGSKAAKTINTILENYINRKSYRPADYLQEEKLQPLKTIWEDFHHKISAARAFKPLTKTYPASSVRVSAFLQQANSPQKIKLQKLSTLPSFNIQSINLGLAMLKSDNISQQSLLDLKIQMLEKQEVQRIQKINQLQQEVKFLEIRLELQKKKEITELEDITLLQNIARSKKSKYSQFLREDSMNVNENAFELKKPMEEKEKPKSACKVLSIFQKKSLLV